MRLLKLKITSASPLLMHSDRYSNPLDPMTKAHKALTGKRKKTDEDQEAILRSEWMGGLYLMTLKGKQVVAMRGANIDSSIFEGAKLDKMGTQFKRGVQVMEDTVPLQYVGPKEINALYEHGAFTDVRGVKVGAARVMRCRPRFVEWSCEISFMLDEAMIDVADFMRAAEKAGRYIGVGDFRPGKRGTCGKFSIEIVSNDETDGGFAEEETDGEAVEA